MLISVLATGSTSAQSAPGPRAAFAFTPIPGLNANAVQHRGKILFAQASNSLHVFSAATRTFKSRTIANTASIRFANDWLCVIEDSEVHAFGAQTGTFRSISIGPSAVVLNPPNQNNDGVLLVRDGTSLHSFSGFTGEWSTRSTSINAQVTVRRDVAVCVDGALVVARSAFEDQWVPMPTGLASPIPSAFADGNLAVIDDGQTLSAFSALLGAWTQHPRPIGLGSIAFGRNLALWSTPGGALGVSAFTASFAEFERSNLTVHSVEDQCAVLMSGTDKATIYAAGVGQFVDVPSPTNGNPIAEETFALVPTLSGLVAVSGIDGSTSSLVLDSIGSIRTASTTAAVSDTSGMLSAVYSSLGPGLSAVDLPSAQATPTRSGILITIPGKLDALVFDARTGTTLHARPSSPRIDADSRSSICVLGDDSGVAIFDPERARLLDVDLGSPLTRSTFWRTTWIGHSGSTITAFGALHGQASQFDRGSSPIELRASSEVGAAIYPDGLLGFASIAEIDSPAQFPEFRRAIPRGASLDLQVHGELGSTALVLLASGPTMQNDSTPSPGALSLGLADLSAFERATIRLSIPNRAALQGLTLEARALWFAPGAGTFAPGDPTRIRLH
ncbi:MAG: hypothetical protein AAF196_20305 [Planctomycetota bacterium]